MGRRGSVLSRRGSAVSRRGSALSRRGSAVSRRGYPAVYGVSAVGGVSTVQLLLFTFPFFSPTTLK